MRGNPGKRKINDREPKPKSVAPAMPGWLDAPAKVEWKRCAPGLVRLGLLTEVDGAVFAAYCTAYSDFVRARRALNRRRSITFVTPNGYPQVRPEVSIANKAMHDMTQLARAFGMDASSRGRMQLPPPADEDDEKFFGDAPPKLTAVR